MQKKYALYVSITVLLLLVSCFSGCVENGEEIDPKIKSIQDAGKLIVGTSTPFEPMEYIENEVYVGFDIELAEKIAEHLGVVVEVIDYTEYDDFEDILDYVVNGDVDIMIAAITINLERAERVDFSNGYLNAGQVIIINDSNEEITSTDDLLNLAVGVQSGTTGEEEAMKYTDNVIGYGDNFTSAAPLNLTAGELDAIIVDYPVGAVIIKDNSDLKIVDDPFTSEYYGISIKKDENGLKTEINDLLNSLESSGDMQTLKDKWLAKT